MRIQQYSEYATKVMHGAESFWENPDIASGPLELIRYATLMGIMAFSGYLCSYAAIGKIWSFWPFVRTAMPVTRGLFCAGLQWVFFAVFPILSSVILDFIFVRRRNSNEMNAWLFVCTYSLTPMYIAALLVGIPFIGRIAATLCLAVFAYLLYYGYRVYCRHTVQKSLLLTSIVFILFAFIRQMFVYVIGV
jgi:hypothetical protein